MTSTRSSSSLPDEASFGSARTPGERLRRLALADWWLAIQVPLALAAVAAGTRRWGLIRVQNALARLVRSEAPPTPDDSADRAMRLAWSVDAIARRVPWRASCLHRSLVLWWVLRRVGIDSDLRIGVRRSRGVADPGGADDGALEFHAWIEHDGRVINDRPDVGTSFAVFDRVIAPTGVRWR